MRWAKLKKHEQRNQIKTVNRSTECGFYEIKFPIGKGVENIE